MALKPYHFIPDTGDISLLQKQEQLIHDRQLLLSCLNGDLPAMSQSLARGADTNCRCSINEQSITITSPLHQAILSVS